MYNKVEFRYIWTKY